VLFHKRAARIVCFGCLSFAFACSGGSTAASPAASGGMVATAGAPSVTSGGGGGTPSSAGAGGVPTTSTGGSSGGLAAGEGGVAVGGSSAGSAGTGGVGGAAAGSGGAAPGVSQQVLQQQFIDLRFGMFIHFGILTYTGKWAEGNLDISQFNPQNLDPLQWAAAAASAKMKFGVLTTRHHDGFALWPSKASNFNVGHIPWRNGQGDVVKEYVDAFRKQGLLPGFYYSIWDTTQGNGPGSITPEKVTYIKTQLTELLSNYGEIPLLVFDGWSWMMGHRSVPFEEIHDLVKSLQPNMLIVDHDGIQSPWDADLVMYEEPRKVFAPTGNTTAAVQGNKINKNGGNDWFWSPTLQNLLTVSAVVDDHLKLLQPRYTNFILNCPPNRDGKLDDTMVTRLKEIGQAWSPDTTRAPLPEQAPLNVHPYMPASAAASSGNAADAIDGVNDLNNFKVWQATSATAQITLDLGKVRPKVGFFGYLPPYSGTGPSANGIITSYALSVSTDGTTFSEVASGTWAKDSKLKAVVFDGKDARYVRLDAKAADGGNPAATELTVGAAP
jgi:alpha-L-fucosidase